jgi:hypothetical protein
MILQPSHSILKARKMSVEQCGRTNNRDVVLLEKEYCLKAERNSLPVAFAFPLRDANGRLFHGALAVSLLGMEIEGPHWPTSPCKYLLYYNFAAPASYRPWR